MIFSRGNQKIKGSFFINGEEIENVKEFKYLGIVIHKKSCSFTPAVSYLKTKATRALYALKAKVNFRHLNIPTALKLYDSLIKPILLYGSEVWETFLDWDSNKWDEGAVEKAYTQFLKQVLGVNRSTTTSFVRAEIGRHSLQEEILRRNIKYARYLHEKEESAYVKQAYDYEVSRDNRSKSFLNTMNRHADIYEISGSFKPYANPFENLYRLSSDNLKLVTRRLFHNIWRKQIQPKSRHIQAIQVFCTI